MAKVLVCGAGGFIGGHLVAALQRRGADVRAVDIKPLAEWFQTCADAENLQMDLRDPGACLRAVEGCENVYNLAADMGGMGFIENHKALCMLSVLINTHLLLAARQHAVRRFFYASSACVYKADRQDQPDLPPLHEDDAYPAMPEDGYGWEKLFSERMCRHFQEDFGLQTRVARFHNVYGSHGAFDGGREKAPAAICRKVIQAKLSGDHSIEIWGDGQQTRSFTYIDDCLHGIGLFMGADTLPGPLNLGSAEKVSINQLVEIVESLAGIRLQRRYNTTAPRGVSGRCSDNSRIRSLFDWEPSTPLVRGMAATYAWIEAEIRAGRSVR